LSGAFLFHRLSRDIDLICHERAAVRSLATALKDAATEAGGELRVVQDAGDFVRAELRLGATSLAVDVALDTTQELEPPASLEGITLESLADLRAAKLTCLLSRSEPRDLVDVLFLDRAGHRPETDLALALKKDAGIDPAVLAWLLGQFPTEPLPSMLAPLRPEELRTYRDELRERLRRLAVPA
jgi:predicted nucleotidyltransferase component of viral defense system